MLAFLTDENFKGDIVRGLRHQRPELNLVRVGNRVGVKASGGVRSAEQMRAMVTAGANRIGTSSGVAILRELGNNHG